MPHPNSGSCTLLDIASEAPAGELRSDPKPLRTPAERDAAQRTAEIFARSADSIEIRLENFTKYVRRQHLKRFLALYEIFKLASPVKGSIVECGVFRGFGVMAWAKLSAILEPENLTRRVYGFDTFAGFPSVDERDRSSLASAKAGDLGADSHGELCELIEQFDRDRFLGHIPKVELVRGDMAKTIPEFVQAHPHLVVSLLYLDADMFAPTKTALDHFLPRMPKGAIVAFDELDNPLWPGETQAVLETVGIHNLQLRRVEWDPYVSFARIG